MVLNCKPCYKEKEKKTKLGKAHTFRVNSLAEPGLIGGGVSKFISSYLNLRNV